MVFSDASPSSEEESASAPVGQLPVGQATAQFPPSEITKFRTLTQDCLDKLRAGSQAGATKRIADLQSAWDNDQLSLQPMDRTAWTYLDGRIDARGPKSTSRVSGGSGLGVAIVAEVVAAHGGTAVIEDSPLGGCAGDGSAAAG